MHPDDRIGYDRGMFQRTDGGIALDVDIAVPRHDFSIGHPDIVYSMRVDDIVVHVVVGIGTEERKGVVLRQQRHKFGSLARQVDVVGGHIPFRLVQGAQELVQGEVEMASLVKVFIIHHLGVEIHMGAIILGKKSPSGSILVIQYKVG